MSQSSVGDPPMANQPTPERQSNNYQMIPIFLGIIVVFMVGVLLYQLGSILLPVVIAVFVSYVFKPLVIYLDKLKVPRAVSIVVVLGIVAGGIYGLYSIIKASGASFVAAAPKYEQRFNTLVADLKVIATEYGIDLDTAVQNGFDFSTINSVLTNGLNSLLSLMSNFFLILLFTLFILAGTGTVAIKIKRAFNAERAEQIGEVIRRIDEKVRKYLLTKTLLNVLMGLVSAGTLALFGVDFALLWGFFAFLLNFIPNIGSVVANILPALITLLQFGAPGTAALVLVLLIVQQNLIGNVLEPRIMASGLNLSPLVVLISLVFWGWLWGIPGMILAAPLTAIIRIVCEQIPQLHLIAVLIGGVDSDSPIRKQQRLLVNPTKGK